MNDLKIIITKTYQMNSHQKSKQIEFVTKWAFFQAVMVRKKQGEVFKRVEVDDEGSFLAVLKEKVLHFASRVIETISSCFLLTNALKTLL